MLTMMMMKVTTMTMRMMVTVMIMARKDMSNMNLRCSQGLYTPIITPMTATYIHINTQFMILRRITTTTITDTTSMIPTNRTIMTITTITTPRSMETSTNTLIQELNLWSLRPPLARPRKICWIC